MTATSTSHAMSIHLYAEHLVNIRTLSIQASLSTATNEETRAVLTADGTRLSLSHERETATIELPIRVPGGQSKATFVLPPVPTKEISFRLQLEEKPGSTFLRGSNDHETDDIVPWTATSLTADAEIACRVCSSTIVSRGSIKSWKDLPSENWAEMMDFWHCHRPDVPHDHDHKTPAKGYSADSRLLIQSGTGMVDPVDFVLAVEDCQNLEVGCARSYPLTSLLLYIISGKKNRSFQAVRSTLRGVSGYKCPRSNLPARSRHQPSWLVLWVALDRRLAITSSILGGYGIDTLLKRTIHLYILLNPPIISNADSPMISDHSLSTSSNRCQQ